MKQVFAIAVTITIVLFSLKVNTSALWKLTRLETHKKIKLCYILLLNYFQNDCMFHCEGKINC